MLGGLGDVTRDAWDRLVATGSPFVEWSWLATLEDSGAASEARGWRPHHFALWEGTRLVGACPAYVKSHSDGEFVFDHGWAAGAARGGIAYYPKLLVAVPFTPVTGERFLAADTDRPGATEALAAALEDTCRRERLSSVHVNFCRPQDAEALVARGWLRRSGYQYHWTNAGFRSFDEYLAAALATPGQGALHLTHIVQPAHEGRGPTRTARSTARGAQSTQTALNMAREYLKATIQQIRDGSLDKGITDLDLEFTFTVTVDDDIAQGIIRIAENGGDGEGDEVFGGCDAIAMTTQGYSGPQPWVGSVAERVLETSRLPLLFVRPGV